MPRRMCAIFQALGIFVALAAVLTAAAALAGDIDVSVEFTHAERLAILSLSADQPPPADPTNKFAQDPRAVEFGKTLFFDQRMSSSGLVSCASCHDPKQAWADGRRVAVGLSIGVRKTPTIANVAYYRWFFRDGRAATLWQQAMQPIQDPREMGQTKTEVLRFLHENPSLSRTYEQIFGPLPGPEGNCTGYDHGSSECMNPADTATVNVAKSLAAFMRTLVYRCSPFDQFADGLRRNDLSMQAAISDDAKRGLRVFLGRGRCISCHHGPAFSDSEFHDTRVPNWPDRFHEDRGRYDGISRLLDDPFGPGSKFSDARESTIARLVGFLRRGAETLGQFKTPSVRNVALTGPYMHSGQYLTLEEVVEHYSEMADKFVLNHHEYGLMDPLYMSKAEKIQIVEFLNSLTDPDLAGGRYPSPKCRWR